VPLTREGGDEKNYKKSMVGGYGVLGRPRSPSHTVNPPSMNKKPQTRISNTRDLPRARGQEGKKDVDAGPRRIETKSYCVYNRDTVLRGNISEGGGGDGIRRKISQKLGGWGGK